MNSSEIVNRENEPCMLKIQYAARSYYNSAEKQNYGVWIFCLLSAFSVFLPEKFPFFSGQVTQYIPLIIPFVADIIAWILMLLVNKNVKKAADLRKYFDAYVLDIKISRFSESEVRRLLEIAEDRYIRELRDAKIQMKHTGRDHPPGVYDWYEFGQQYDNLEAKFECQRQNTWWDKKVFPQKYVVMISSLILIIGCFIFLALQSAFFRALLCSAGLFIKLCERICENIKYHNLSKKIDGCQESIEGNYTVKGIETLQEFIDERRAINILGINLLHKFRALNLAERYRKISRHE